MTTWRGNGATRELNDTLAWPEQSEIPCSLMPVGVRNINQTYTNEIDLVFEQPPMKMNMRISNALVKELNTLADIKIDYEIPLPWLVYRIGAHTSNDGVTWQLSRVAVYARSEPMSSDNTNLHPIPLPNIHTSMSVCLDHVQTSSGNRCSNLESVIQEVLESVWAANFNGDLMSAIMACEVKRVPRALWYRIGSYKTIHDVFRAWEEFSLEEVSNWAWGDSLTDLDKEDRWSLPRAAQLLTMNSQAIKKRVRHSPINQVITSNGGWYNTRDYTADLDAVNWEALGAPDGAVINNAFRITYNLRDYLPAPEVEINPPEQNDLF